MTRKRWINALFQPMIGMAVLVMAGCTQTSSEIPSETRLSFAKSAENASETPAVPPPRIVHYRNANLTDLNLNNRGNQITIKPGSIIEASLNYAYHCPGCNQTLSNQIIVGLARRSAQACIYNGGTEAQGSVNFQIKVPAKPGKYDVRFRVLQATDCQAALKAGWGDDDSPSKETTLGRIIASKKAEG